MSVLVYTENWDGKFKKLSNELVSYAYALAQKMSTTATVVSIGNVAEDELKKFADFGAAKIINVNDSRIKGLDNKVFTSIIAQVAEKEGSKVVVLANNFTGKAIAPRISVKMRAGLASGVNGLPSEIQPFTISKKVFNGGAYSNVKINTELKILSLLQNSFGIHENTASAVIENFSPQIDDAAFSTTITDVNKVTGKIILTDAEIVVSGGRGMKSGDNWAPLEELADTLGAALACSRPVSDEGWRPHEEHVGQTGKIIAPDLYFAIGISGAIQHIAGVSASKCIVAINKDDEAPVFESADYGIVGDAMKVIPELTAAVKELKAG